MRERVRSRRNRLLLPFALLVLGCGGRSTVERSTSQGEDPMGEPISTSSSSVTLHGSRAEAQLATAKSKAREGHFDEAVRDFKALYQDEGNPEAVRAEALFHWANAEGSLLNLGRDLDAAIGHLELFLDQFPRSPLVPDAKEALERLRVRRDAAGEPAGTAG